MFTECRPSHRESAGQLGAGSSQSLTVAHGKWPVMTLPCISPFQPLDFKREAGGQGGFERVQQEVSLLPHPTPSPRAHEAGWAVVWYFSKFRELGL